MELVLFGRLVSAFVLKLYTVSYYCRVDNLESIRSKLSLDLSPAVIKTKEVEDCQAQDLRSPSPDICDLAIAALGEPRDTTPRGAPMGEVRRICT